MSDKNNDMAVGIAIGGAGGLCLFVLYKLFSSMSETREQLRRMRTPSPPPYWGPDSGYKPFGSNEYDSDDGWPFAGPAAAAAKSRDELYPDAVSIGGKRKSRRKTKRRRKSRRTKRRRRKR